MVGTTAANGPEQPARRFEDLHPPNVRQLAY